MKLGIGSRSTGAISDTTVDHDDAKRPEGGAPNALKFDMARATIGDNSFQRASLTEGKKG